MRIAAALSTATTDDSNLRIVAAMHGAGSPNDAPTLTGRQMKQAAVVCPFNGRDDEPYRETAYPWLLASFAHPAATPERLPDRVVGATLLWIDSGAFTVWQQNGTIALADYLTYLRELHAVVPVPIIPINLDVIPGKRGRAPTKTEAATALKASAENAAAMRETGYAVMEVWHRGEPLDQLLEIAGRRRPGELIGLGGLVGMRFGQLTEVVDPCFRVLLDTFGKDKLPPVHGLGVGGREAVFRYPWWSSDSTSWFSPGQFGRTMRRGGAASKTEPERLRNPDMRRFEQSRYLREWLRWNETATKLWEERGVVHDSPPI